MATVRILCPQCSHAYTIDESILGKKARCKKCDTSFVLTSSAPPVDEPEAKILFGDFVLEGKLGEGGMGTVSLVRSKTTGQPFAVKKTKFQDEKSRRNFLTELQTWLDLPEHPHLTACRFFRTEADAIAVFAEYVDGGSLHAWIRGRKLLRLEQILDVAIQFAWGLHAAHEAGLVHQDVKPGNVLLTADGLAKVTDFGLARARGLVGGEAQDTPGQSILVSYGGMTLAYCSPEQAARKRLNRKTDIWSWGVSVLEMFTGEVTWRSGTVALKVLETILKAGPDENRPPMPAAVAEILRRCFRQAPADRWASLDEAAQRLQEVYRHEIGHSQPRQQLDSEIALLNPKAAEDRRTAIGVPWDDPRTYLTEALREAGRDISEAEVLLPPSGKSRKAQAIADLTVYEEARRLFQQLIAEGRKDLENRLATLCHEKALVHGHVEDSPGQLALYDQAIAIRERLVNQEGRRELADELGWLYQDKALSVRALGDHHGAVALYDRAVAIYERLVNQESRRELANDLARIYSNKAGSLRILGNNRGAMALFDQAIAIHERLVNQEGRRELANDLAGVYQNKAIELCVLGDNRGAVALYDQAIAICERLVHQEGRRELANNLAGVYQNKANAVSDLGDNRGAVALYDQAIAIRERLVHQEGRRELANDLAMVYENKANAVGNLGDNRGAVALYDQAIAICERLVNQEGRPELQGELAWVRLYRAELLVALGNRLQGQAEAQAAVVVLKAEIDRTGRADLKSVLQWANSALRDVL